MSFGGFTAAAAKVVLGVDSAQFHEGIHAAEADYLQATAKMGGATAEFAERSLRAANASELYNRMLKQLGPTALETQRALAVLVGEQRRLADVQLQSTAATQRFERGLLAGTGRTLGFGRALSFASNAFLGGAGLVYALHSAVDASARFQKEMTLIHTQALAPIGEVTQKSKELLKVSGSLGSGPTELAKGLYRVESAGYRTGAALKYLTTAAKGAKLGDADLEQTATALIAAGKSGITVARGFRDADNSGTKLARTMATIDAIVGAGNMRMDDLTRALESGVVPAARQFGITFQELGAALDTLTVQGQPAELSATRLRYTIALLGASTPKAEKNLRQLGIESGDIARKMRTQGLIPALELLDKKLKNSNLSIEDQNRLLVRSYGGGRSSTTILALLQNLDLLKSKYKEIVEQGTPEKFNERWLKTTQTAAFAFSRLSADVEKSKIELGAALAQPFVHGADAVAKWLESERNQARLRHDLLAFMHQGASAAKLFATGMHQVTDVLHTVDHGLHAVFGNNGGVMKLFIEALALRELAKFARGVNANVLNPLRDITKTANATTAAVERTQVAIGGSAVGSTRPGTLVSGGAPLMVMPASERIANESTKASLADASAAKADDAAWKENIATRKRALAELRLTNQELREQQANAKLTGKTFAATASQVIEAAREETASIDKTTAAITAQTAAVEQLTTAQARIGDLPPGQTVTPEGLAIQQARREAERNYEARRAISGGGGGGVGFVGGPGGIYGVNRSAIYGPSVGRATVSPSGGATYSSGYAAATAEARRLVGMETELDRLQGQGIAEVGRLENALKGVTDQYRLQLTMEQEINAALNRPLAPLDAAANNRVLARKLGLAPIFSSYPSQLGGALDEKIAADEAAARRATMERDIATTGMYRGANGRFMGGPRPALWSSGQGLMAQRVAAADAKALRNLEKFGNITGQVTSKMSRFGGFFSGPSGGNRAAGAGMAAMLLGGQMGGKYGSLLTGTGTGMMLAPMLGVNPLIGAAVGGSFAIKHIVGGTGGSILGAAGEGAALGALGGSIIPGVGTAAGAAVGGVAGLGLALMHLHHDSDQASSSLGRLGESLTKTQMRTRNARLAARAYGDAIVRDRVGVDEARQALQQAKAHEKATRGTRAHSAAVHALALASLDYKHALAQLHGDENRHAAALTRVKNQTSYAKAQTHQLVLQLAHAGKEAIDYEKKARKAGFGSAAAALGVKKYVSQLRKIADEAKTTNPQLARTARELIKIAQDTNKIPTDPKYIQVIVEYGYDAKSLQATINAAEVSFGALFKSIGPAAAAMNPIGALGNGAKETARGQQVTYRNGKWYGSNGKPLNAAGQDAANQEWLKKHGPTNIPKGAHEPGVVVPPSPTHHHGGRTHHGGGSRYHDPGGSGDYQGLETQYDYAKAKGDKGGQERALKRQIDWLWKDYANAKTDGQRQQILQEIDQKKGDLDSLQSGDKRKGRSGAAAAGRASRDGLSIVESEGRSRIDRAKAAYERHRTVRNERAVIRAYNQEEASIAAFLKSPAGKHLTRAQRARARAQISSLERQEAGFEQHLNGGLGGSEILPYSLQIAYDRARRTKGTKDDVRALKAEEKYLHHYLENKKLSSKARAKAEHLLTAIDLKLQKLIDGQTAQMKAAQQHFLSEQASFWATFASNDFHDSAFGRQIGAAGGTNIEIHQHFPHKPTHNGAREALTARAAAHAAFESGY